MPGDMHTTLVQKAARWIIRAHRCTFALCEPYAAGIELPDVIGWQMRGYSVLVECKASRADFLADRKKTCRQATSRFWNMGLGQERWYCAPEGIIAPDELPDRWGLIVLRPSGRLQRAREAHRNAETGGDIDPEIQRREFGVLLPAMRRMCEGYGPQPWLKFNPTTEAAT